MLANAGSLFEGKRGPKPADAQGDPDRLYAKTGRLNMELDWLKKKSGINPYTTPGLDGLGDVLAVSRQCQLLADPFGRVRTPTASQPRR